MRMCLTIPPRREDIIGHRDDDYMGECILPEHWGPHVLLTPEGQYIRWKTDCDCDPDCVCHDEEGDECYTFGEISFEEFQRILREVVSGQMS